jgi:hypothetical protein
MNRDENEGPGGNQTPEEQEAAEDQNPSTPTPATDGMTQGKATGWPREPGKTHYHSRDPGESR